MRPFDLGALAIVLGAAAGPGFADTTEVLYQHKSWVVQGVTADDGSVACLAEVADPGESFTIWVFADKSIRLQFYSEDWDFGEGETADMQVEIDRRSPWNLTGANLSNHSVLFDLPDEDASVNFIVEVAKGNTLHLRSADASPVRDYTLAGSSASIQYLVECGNAISGDRNPFN